MKVLLTGHTGFKGSWFTLLLNALGYEVSGYSIDYPKSGLYEKGNIKRFLTHEIFGDVRDLSNLSRFFDQVKPDIAVHFAAQPLVINSYRDPVETFTVNVDGTLNFLRASSGTDSCRTTLVITTDKVYRNEGKKTYSEEDALGGYDPYSASKAMSDILTQSWSNITPHQDILVARAGNVIGANDVSENRLIPDITRAILADSPVEIRNPHSVRPWQHVLDCLGGYIAYIQKYEKGKTPNVLNFGPSALDFHSVQEIAQISRGRFPNLQIKTVESSGPKETEYLALDSTLAAKSLDWRNVFSFHESVEFALEIGESASVVANSQLQKYLSRAKFLNFLK